MLGEAEEAPPILLPDPDENITSKHERKPFSIVAKQSKLILRGFNFLYGAMGRWRSH